MTDIQIDGIKFKFQSHLSMEDRHSTVYKAIDVPFHLSICDSVPYRDGEPSRKGTRHYMLDGVVYKTKEKLLTALSEKEWKQ